MSNWPVVKMKKASEWPDWAKWKARDANQREFYFEFEPTASQYGFWDGNGGRVQPVNRGNWVDSLIKRPEEE